MRIVFFTGAGISAPSGIQPYRGEGGLWTEHPELEKLVTADTFQTNPGIIWDYVIGTRDKCREAEPNAAHLAIAKLAGSEFHEVTVITQNVDHLHRRAANAYNVVHDILTLHGDIEFLVCQKCNSFATYDEVDSLDQFYKYTCPWCSCDLRPHVVLFGEDLDDTIYGAALNAIENAEMVIAVGTTGSVWPAANMLVVANDRKYKEYVPFHYFNKERNHEDYPFATYHYGDASVELPLFLEGISQF